MPLSKLQKAELKKIGSSYKKMERFSAKNSIPLDEFVEKADFFFEDKSEARRREVMERNDERRSVYRSEQRSDRAF